MSITPTNIHPAHLAHLSLSVCVSLRPSSLSAAPATLARQHTRTGGGHEHERAVTPTERKRD